MFFIEFEPQFGTTRILCSYLPHASLKQFNMMDFVIYTGSKDSDMYVLQCAQGFEKSIVDNTDPFTHHVGDWKGNVKHTFINCLIFWNWFSEDFDCTDTPQLSITEETTSSSKYYSQMFGNQYQRKLECWSQYEYNVEKTVRQHITNESITYCLIGDHCKPGGSRP